MASKKTAKTSSAKTVSTKKANSAKKTSAKKIAPKKAAPKKSPKKLTAPKKVVSKKAGAQSPKVSPKASAPKKTKAANASPRMTAKVSPLRGMAIEDWVAKKTSGWQSTVVRRILEIAKNASPEATCSIKWGQPVFDHNGPFAFVKPAKAHVTFGFWRGAEMHDPKGLLSEGARMSHWKLKSEAELDEPTLTAFIREAVRLNREKGNPTKRG